MSGKEFLCMFPLKYREILGQAAEHADCLEELRLRAGSPIFVRILGKEFSIGAGGRLKETPEKCPAIGREELVEILQHLCNYSLSAYKEEIKAGFFTLPEGHRVGIAGEVVSDAVGNIVTIKNICYLNLRIAHEIKGTGNKLLPYLYKNGIFRNTLIFSPPGCGKTTLLRDVIRLISDGNKYGGGRNVGVVDERFELAGSYLGVAENDLGIRTDVMSGCSKAIGMMILLRSMRPSVIAVDELGGEEDVHAVEMVLRCGCGILATIHAENMEEIRSKKDIKRLLEEKAFQNYVQMGKMEDAYVIKEVYQEETV